MVKRDLGQATIAYEDTDGDTVEETVENEHLAYFQDHWMIKAGEHDAGQDIVRRVPLQRVYYVERDVEAFEQEVSTLQDRVQSITDELRSRILGSGRESTTGGTSGSVGERENEPHRIEVESGEPSTVGGSTGGTESGGSSGTSDFGDDAGETDIGGTESSDDDADDER